jgi:hypothetical protein
MIPVSWAVSKGFGAVHRIHSQISIWKERQPFPYTAHHPTKCLLNPVGPSGVH